MFGGCITGRHDQQAGRSCVVLVREVEEKGKRKDENPIENSEITGSILGIMFNSKDSNKEYRQEFDTPNQRNPAHPLVAAKSAHAC